MRRGLSASVWLGSQAFNLATVFNANIGAWNVLRVTTYTSAFDGVGLADCIKRDVYDNWGSTFRTAAASAGASSWSSLPVCTPTPTTALPSTATPRYSCPSGCARVSACECRSGTDTSRPALVDSRPSAPRLAPHLRQDSPATCSRACAHPLHCVHYAGAWDTSGRSPVPC